eukprot:5054881-Pyramimonas_sp.AAC.1
MLEEQKSFNKRMQAQRRRGFDGQDTQPVDSSPATASADDGGAPGSAAQVPGPRVPVVDLLNQDSETPGRPAQVSPEKIDE